MKTIVTTPPSGYVVPLNDIKAHLRIIGNEQDALLQSLSLAAQQYLERATGWTLLKTRLTSYYDDVGSICISRRPALIVHGVSYVDPSGTTVALDSGDYTIVRHSLDYGVQLNKTIELGAQPNRIIVDYSVGYETAAAVDELLKAALKGLVAHWYSNPSPVVTGTISTELPYWIETIIDTYRVREV